MTKEQIEILLMRQDNMGMHAIGRALRAINRYQTATEKQIGATINQNGEGFMPCDAKKGTGMAEHYDKFTWLSEKQLAYWRKPNAKGKPRILKYAGQLERIVKEKA